jgi:PAS domain S-box-containing protein
LATDAFLTIIPNGEICDANEAAIKLLGYSREELKELTVWQIFAPEVAEEAYCEWKRQVKDKGYFVMETFWAHYNGAQIPVIVSGRSLKLAGKAQFHIIAHDITELRRTEHALRESEKKYRELVENLHEGIWVIDKDGFTTFVNPHMADMLGYKMDEMKGMHLFSFMNKHGIEASKTNLERRKQGIKGRQNLEFLRKDGKRVYVSMETSPLTDDNGDYIGAIAGVMDITERKRENEALASTNARLKHLLRFSPAVIYSCEAHRNYSITYISENISAQLGYTPQEILSYPKFWLDHIHSEDISKVLEAHNEVINKGYSIHEYRFLHKDGTYRWIHDESKIVKDEDGNPTEIVGCLLDITGKKSTD